MILWTVLDKCSPLLWSLLQSMRKANIEQSYNVLLQKFRASFLRGLLGFVLKWREWIGKDSNSAHKMYLARHPNASWLQRKSIEKRIQTDAFVRCIFKRFWIHKCTQEEWRNHFLTTVSLMGVVVLRAFRSLPNSIAEHSKTNIFHMQILLPKPFLKTMLGSRTPNKLEFLFCYRTRQQKTTKKTNSTKTVARKSFKNHTK